MLFPCRDGRIDEIRECHARYCQEQLRNDKTRRVLAAAFSEDFANEYMSNVMFDYGTQHTHEAVGVS